MRRFVGYRPEPPAEYIERGTAAPPDQPQYEGVVFADGSVALRWRTEYKSTSVWTSYQDFYHVHGHPEYGTRIEWLDHIHTTEVEQLRRTVEHYERMLGAFCPCDMHDPNTDGPQQDCPIHGDGVTFARWISDTQNELAERRASVTTGGPAPGFTQPPEEIVVSLPVSEEKLGELQYNDCDDCGRPHPAWLGCEAERLAGEDVHPHGNPHNCPCPNEAPAPAVDYVEKPPDR